MRGCSMWRLDRTWLRGTLPLQPECGQAWQHQGWQRDGRRTPFEATPLRTLRSRPSTVRLAGRRVQCSMERQVEWSRRSEEDTGTASAGMGSEAERRAEKERDKGSAAFGAAEGASLGQEQRRRRGAPQGLRLSRPPGRRGVSCSRGLRRRAAACLSSAWSR